MGSAQPAQRAAHDGLHRFEVGGDEIGAELRIGVSDASPVELSLPPEAEPGATSGRGLHLVDSLTDRWDVQLAETGKTVWFELDA